MTDNDSNSEWKPNRWVAALAVLWVWPVGLLYLGRWWLPFAYFAAFILMAAVGFYCDTSLIVAMGLLLTSPFIAFWLAHKMPAIRRPWYSRWYGILAASAGLLVTIGLIRALLIEPFHLSNASMEPGLPRGSFVAVSKIGYRNVGTFGISLGKAAPSKPPHRGAVVVFDYPVNPKQHFIKRILGLPGDVITSKGKAISVNGVPLSQPAIDGTLHEQLDGTSYEAKINDSRPANDFEWVVPEGEYFLVGDNRDGSLDSRFFGPVPAELLVGEVVGALWWNQDTRTMAGLLP